MRYSRYDADDILFEMFEISIEILAHGFCNLIENTIKVTKYIAKTIVIPSDSDFDKALDFTWFLVLVPLLGFWIGILSRHVQILDFNLVFDFLIVIATVGVFWFVICRAGSFSFLTQPSLTQPFITTKKL